MTRCGLSDGVTIEFPNTGIEVRPRDADVRAQRRNFVMSKFELPEAAAKLVAKYVPKGDYAYIRFDGTIARRVYRPPDAIQFKEDLQETTYGELTLKDPRYVLNRGNVTKYWDTATLGDIVDYIMDQVVDPHGVVTDYRFMTPELRERERIAAFDYPSPFGVLDVANRIADALVGFGGDVGEWLGEDMSSLRTSTIDLEDVSPLEALQRVMDDFSMDWWVDEDGVLWIGPNVANGQVMGTVAGDNNIALKDYSITRVPEATSSVQVTGPLKNSGDIPGTSYAVSEGGLQVIAEAKAPGLEGAPMALETERRVTEPEDLESMAALALMQEMMDDVEGSLTINGLASRETEVLARLDIGDVLYVDDSIETECNQNVTTGLFMVNSLQHRANERRGWEITMRVGRIIDPDALRLRSVIYDPATDTAYSDLDAFRSGDALTEQEDDGAFAGRDVEDFFVIL